MAKSTRERCACLPHPARPRKRHLSILRWLLSHRDVPFGRGADMNHTIVPNNGLGLVLPSFLVGAEAPWDDPSLKPLWPGCPRPAHRYPETLTPSAEHREPHEWSSKAVIFKGDDKASPSEMINTISGCLIGSVGLAQAQGRSNTPASMYMCDFP